MKSANDMDEVSDAYETNALEFLRRRDDSPIGSCVVAQWSETLRKGSTVIELACGGGYPVTRVLENSGLQLWAIDSSPTLIAEFKKRFPLIPTQCASVQNCDFFNLTFDAAIAVGLVFLLSEGEQIKLISRISQLLNPRGRFLFTAPIQSGCWADMNTGLECNSLGQSRYEEVLAGAGFRVLSTVSDRGENNFYDVERI